MKKIYFIFTKMEFEAKYPVHPNLQKHIKYYYFVKTSHSNHHSLYYSFPNTTIPINIHKNVTCKIAGSKVTVSEAAQLNYLTIANGLRESPLVVEWNGLIDKVTIAFSATGINYFINRGLNESIAGFTSLFTGWDGSGYSECLERFFSGNDIQERVHILEDFLLSMYHPFEKANILEPAIRLLADFNHEMTISQIAAQIKTSERTLNRLFKLHIGISPVAYRKIARFRQSLENKVVKEKFKRLTDIGYESNYYDQAYFIKMYNKLSGKSPKDLYKSVNKLADDNVIFEFLENSIEFG
ncbi:MAG: helix-turn-helix domain-containing protein [Niabella sp.]